MSMKQPLPSSLLCLTTLAQISIKVQIYISLIRIIYDHYKVGNYFILLLWPRVAPPQFICSVEPWLLVSLTTSLIIIQLRLRYNNKAGER